MRLPSSWNHPHACTAKLFLLPVTGCGFLHGSPTLDSLPGQEAEDRPVRASAPVDASTSQLLLPPLLSAPHCQPPSHSGGPCCHPSIPILVGEGFPKSFHPITHASQPLSRVSSASQRRVLPIFPPQHLALVPCPPPWRRQWAPRARGIPSPLGPGVLSLHGCEERQGLRATCTAVAWVILGSGGQG